MRTVFIAVSLFLSGLAFSQQPNLDHLMTKRIIHFDEINLNCLTLIPQYYRANQIDSVKLLLTYWKNRCGLGEPQSRIETLLSLRENRFSDSTSGPDLYDFLQRYRNTYDINLELPQSYWYDRNVPPVVRDNYKQFIQVSNAFNLFTQNIAEEIQRRYPEGSMDWLICEFYKNNFEPLLVALQSPQFPENNLKRSYQKDVHRAQKIFDTHVSFFTGLWIPRDSLSRLGTHPLLGFSAGIVRKKFTLDGTLSFGLIESKNWYVVYDENKKRHESDRFGGFMISAEPSYNILNTRSRSALLITAGIGYESITPVRGKEDEQEGVTIGTFSSTVGLGYRLFIGPTRERYIGVQGRYHLLNFSTRGGSDLNGNAFTFRLSFGGISQWRKKALEQLYYKSH